MNRSISPRQLDLLRQIVRDDYQPTSEEATTVYALRSRGLVTTRGMFAYHTATATDAGRATVTGQRAPVNVPPPQRGPGVRQEVVDMSDVPRSAAALADRLRAEGGRIVVTDPPPTARRSWRQVVFAAQNDPTATNGWQVRHRGRDHGNLEIWLEAPTGEPATAPASAVVMLDNLRGAHSLVAALGNIPADTDGWIDTRLAADVVHVRIHKTSRRRATLVLHSLVQAAQARGFEVAGGQGQDCGGGIWVTKGGHKYELTVLEESTRRDHQLSPDEQRQKERGDYWWGPRWDYEPSGRLSIREGHSSYHAVLANDRTRWTVETRLGHALKELERLVDQAEQRRLEQIRQERLQLARWQTAMAEAKRDYEEHQRIAHLETLMRRHDQAGRIGTFVEAAAATNDNLQVRGFLEWARRYATTIDPLIGGITAPQITEPTVEQLRPFLNGVSPYRPLVTVDLDEDTLPEWLSDLE